MAFPVRHAHVEALLRERKLDRTLTTALPLSPGADRVAPSGLTAFDGRLPGGLPRGQISEVIGPASSGRTSLAWTWLGAATARSESAALVDTFDRFDPASGHACGIHLARLLWVRGQAITRTAAAIDPTWLPGTRAVDGPGTLLERTIDRALKALNLVLQSGVCTAVVLDFADVPPAGVRRVPQTTWLRLQRVVEGTDIACLLLGAVPLTRSAGGVTLNLGALGAPSALGALGAGATGAGLPADLSAVAARAAKEEAPSGAKTGAAKWAGAHDRSRRLAGLRVTARLSSPRRLVQGTAAIATVMRQDAWAGE
jgi:hypothetical protein